MPDGIEAPNQILEAIWTAIYNVTPQVRVGDLTIDREVVFTAFVLGLAVVAFLLERLRRGRRVDATAAGPPVDLYAPQSPMPYDSMSGFPAPVRTRTYAGRTQAEAAQAFEVDAAEAARAGYVPTSQAWQGTVLTVTYQHQGAARGVAAPAQRPAPSRVPPLVLIGGAAVIAVGCLLPWYTAGSAFVDLSLAGTETDDGRIVLAVAGFIALMGLLTPRGGGMRILAAVLAVLAALLALGTAVVDVQDIWDQAGQVPRGAAPQVGVGLWTVLVGSVLALIGAGWSVVRR